MKFFNKKSLIASVLLVVSMSGIAGAAATDTITGTGTQDFYIHGLNANQGNGNNSVQINAVWDNNINGYKLDYVSGTEINKVVETQVNNVVEGKIDAAIGNIKTEINNGLNDTIQNVIKENVSTNLTSKDGSVKLNPTDTKGGYDLSVDFSSVNNKIDTTVDGIKADITNVNNSINNVKTDIKDLGDNLANQIEKNEVGISANQTAIKENQEAIKDLNAKVDANKNDLTNKINNDIKNLSDDLVNQIEKNEASISANQSAIKDLDAKVENNIKDVNNKIDATNNSVAALDKNLTDKINNDIAALDQSLNNKIDLNGSAIKDLDAKVENNIKDVNSKIDASNNELTNKINNDIAALDQSLNNKIDLNGSAIKDLDAKVENNIKDVNNKIDASNNELTNKINNDIAALDQSLNNKIDLNGSAIKENQNKIENLDAKVDSNNKEVNDRIDAVIGSQANHIETGFEGNTLTIQLHNISDGNTVAISDKYEIRDIASATDVGNIDDLHDSLDSKNLVDAINETYQEALKKDTFTNGSNINIETAELGNGGTAYTIGLSQDIDVNSITSNSVNVGSVVIDDKGINAGGQKVTNVENGEVSVTSKDAVNGSQLYNEIANREQATQALDSRINKLSGEIDTVGALSAALAGLHPRFQDGNKGEFAAAIGTYDGKQALAFGGFYAPNQEVMFSVGAAITEGGKKMGNLGVNFALDRSKNRKAAPKDIVYTRKEVDSMLKAQSEQIALLMAEVQALKAKQ